MTKSESELSGERIRQEALQLMDVGKGSMTKNDAEEVEPKEILGGLLRRDEDALRTLFRYYGPKLRAWLLARFGRTLQRAELDHVLSVTAFNAWRFADRFDESRGPLEAWLITIAGNAARSVLRGERAHRSAHLEYDESYDPAHADVVLGQDLDEGENRMVADLERAIQRLPPLQRSIVEADLASGGHADDDRLAATLNTSKNSIQVSRNKARKNILKFMKEDGYDETGRKVES